MFKVICIDGLTVGDSGYTSVDKTKIKCEKSEEIYEGEVYTVANQFRIDGKFYYNLIEKGLLTGYNIKRFIPLSSENKVELVNNKQEEYA